MVFLVAAALVAPHQDHTPENVQDTFLKTQLIGMWMSDQDVRMRWISYTKQGKEAPKAVIREMIQVDKKNLAQLKEIVAEHGWPTISMVGPEAASDAFDLVQHGGSDKPFMRKCLSLMKPLLAKGEVSKQSYAMLYDRTSLEQGKKQLYGSQVKFVNGEWVLEPCEDTAHLAQRRKAMGMMPIKEYLKFIQDVYGSHDPFHRDEKTGHGG
ncbi:MAG TPA: DUF6624 domain-containing protein [Fimbriimonadaceae bacterium]|nr:DUF6624 domain-containing protein [Fimbriimonadaceae bacterium]